MQRSSAKRPCPTEDGGDSRRVRFKPMPEMEPMLSNLSPSDREALERTAAILNRPLSELLPSGSDNPSLQPLDLAHSEPHGSTSAAPSRSRLRHFPYALEMPPPPSFAHVNSENYEDLRQAGLAGNVLDWHTDASDFGVAEFDGTGAFPWAEEYYVPSLPASSASNDLNKQLAFSDPSHGLNTHQLAPVSHHTPSPLENDQKPGLETVQPGVLVGLGSGPIYHDISPSVSEGSGIGGLLVTDDEPWVDVGTNTIIPAPMSDVQVQQSVDLGWSPVKEKKAPKKPAPPSNVSQDQGFEVVQWNPNRPAPAPQQRTRGKFQDPKLREEAADTRKRKACVRCRFMKIKCRADDDDPSGECVTCREVSNQKVHTQPCLRYRITACTLYRTGKAPGLEFTFRWPVMKLKDISKWASTDARTIRVASDVCPIPLEFTVRRFVPVPQDSLHRAWMDGRVKKFKETTPFAIINMKNAVLDMRQYITANVFECMDYFLRDSDELVKMTYAFARKHVLRTSSPEEQRLMGNYFRFWFAVKRTATTEHIISDDKLDMKPEREDKSYPLFGKVPLPPVMIQQLDMILTLGVLIPLQKQVLEDFQKIVLSKQPRSWLTVYLITFMSLHDCATTSEENYRNARKHGLRRRYSIPTFISERHHSANVFLSHYHYCKEPCDPFNLDWKRRQTTPFADLSPDEILFIQKTKQLIEEKRAEIHMLNELALYEHPLYFISQMFEDNWSPRDTIIQYDDGTINDVPLRRFYADESNDEEEE